jgi:hypothetical protein
MTSPDTDDIMGRATKRVEAAARRSSQAKPWEDLVSRLALALNCLPSSFVDENDHLFKAIDKLKANAARAESLASADEGVPDFLSETDVARVYREAFGGPRFSQCEREFAANIEAAVRQRFIAALSAQSTAADRWISVDERLPELNTEVLVAFKGIPIASTGQYTGSPHDVAGWCYPSENNGCCDDGTDPVVIAWMPLPDAALAAHEAKHGGKG